MRLQLLAALLVLLAVHRAAAAAEDGTTASEGPRKQQLQTLTAKQLKSICLDQVEALALSKEDLVKKEAIIAIERITWTP